MRLHLFEFEDQPWFPDAIRVGGTDYLRYFLKVVHFYSPAETLIAEALKKTGDVQVLDLCSGGGGSMEQVQEGISAKVHRPVPVTLSDRFPNLAAYTYLKQKTGGRISFIPGPIEAAEVPAELKGFRTMFSAAHHFRPEAIGAVLQDAVRNRAGIGIFDGGDKNIFIFLALILFHPILLLVCTPFFRPFKFSRIFFTYLLPFIPLYTVWDGCVSILRLYHPAGLLKLAQQMGANDYTWQAGKLRNKFGFSVTYLVGYPTHKSA